MIPIWRGRKHRVTQNMESNLGHLGHKSECATNYAPLPPIAYDWILCYLGHWQTLWEVLYWSHKRDNKTLGCTFRCWNTESEASPCRLAPKGWWKHWTQVTRNSSIRCSRGNSVICTGEISDLIRWRVRHSKKPNAWVSEVFQTHRSCRISTSTHR